MNADGHESLIKAAITGARYGEMSEEMTNKLVAHDLAVVPMERRESYTMLPQYKGERWNLIQAQPKKQKASGQCS